MPKVAATSGGAMAKIKRPGSDILSFTRQVLWSNGLNGLLGRVLGGLSILALARYAFNFGLSAAGAAIFSYYNRLLRVLLGWADPLIESLVAKVSDLINIGIVFNGYWHHVFVVLQLLFARDAGVAFVSGRRSVGFVRVAVGFVLAVVVAILAAVTFSGVSFLVANIVFASLPMLAIFVYDFIMYCHAVLFQMDYLNRVDETPNRTRRAFFGSAMKRAVLRLGLVLVVSYLVFAVPAIRHAAAPAGGLVAIGLGTVANASYWLVRGASYARIHRNSDTSWSTAFSESEAGRFGVAVSGVLIWALVFSALNTGMQQVGL